MKKGFFFLIALLFIALTQAQWTNKRLKNGAADTSRSYYVGNLEGFFSLQIKVDSGRVLFSCLTANDTSFWVEPTAKCGLIDSVTDSSGVNEDGKEFVSFTPPYAQYIKLVARSRTGDTARFTTKLGVFAR